MKHLAGADISGMLDEDIYMQLIQQTDETALLIITVAGKDGSIELPCTNILTAYAGGHLDDHIDMLILRLR